MEEFGRLERSEKPIAILGDRWWPQSAKQDGDRISKHFVYVKYGRSVMSAVFFSQFLGPASMVFFPFPFVASSCLVYSFTYCYFPFLFRFLIFRSFSFFSFLCFFSIDSSLTCVCVVTSNTCNIHTRGAGIFWVASGVVGFFRRDYRVRRMHRYGPGTS